MFFHVIATRTSYNLLLERPWLHENGVVPSTVHQCFKYIKNGEIVKVDANMKSFAKAESYFADTKLYLDLDSMLEVLPLKILVDHSLEEVHPRATPIENNDEILSKAIKNEAPASGKHEVKKPPYSLVFRSNHISIDEGSNLDISEDEIQNAPPQLEYGVKVTIYELKELNLGTIEEPRPIFISALLSPEEEKQYFKTLGEYKDVFAWMYKEMQMPLKTTFLCISSNSWLMPPLDMSIVFMDGSSGYNQIRMSPKDKECTTFHKPEGIYCYKAVNFLVVANFLADHPMPTKWEISDDFPDEDIFSIEILLAWTMLFDGEAQSNSAGAGIVFVSLEKQSIDLLHHVNGEWLGESIQEDPLQPFEEGLTAKDNACLRLEELEELDEKGLRLSNNSSAIKLAWQRHSTRKVRPQSFQIENLILAVRRPITLTQGMGNKFMSKWDGPCGEGSLTNGSYKLVDKDGVRIGPINGKFLKCYYL
ncbi:hypothetical protein Sango_1589100 [Sesamum angolense]|uniref:Uncharacterized protein n=1 Tax=Sesamum angolense TaxID=2727404 RepID=A0AAE1WQ95_9LAMI|nr:hypothetical protein Sango_1589100 [Sesamum angolense]